MTSLHRKEAQYPDREKNKELEKCGTRFQQILTMSLTEADLAHFNLECLAAASKVLDLNVDNRQSGWFSRLHLEDGLCPGPLLVLAFVGEDGISRLPAVPDLQVVPGHQAHCMPLVVRPVEMGNSVLAVEGDGLLRRSRRQLEEVHLVAVGLVVDVKCVAVQLANPRLLVV